MFHYSLIAFVRDVSAFIKPCTEMTLLVKSSIYCFIKKKSVYQWYIQIPCVDQNIWTLEGVGYLSPGAEH